MTSLTTKRIKRKYNFVVLLSFLFNFCPFFVYGIKALFEADLVHEKVALSMTVLIVLILTIISKVNEIMIKSRLWIILLGIYFCIDYILYPLLIIAITQIIDELILMPLKKYLKNKKTINMELDKRL